MYTIVKICKIELLVLFKHEQKKCPYQSGFEHAHPPNPFGKVQTENDFFSGWLPLMSDEAVCRTAQDKQGLLKLAMNESVTPVFVEQPRLLRVC